ncbi:MAG: hypothetical protein ACFB10_07860 [Salibacteraceae bacterium]
MPQSQDDSYSFDSSNLLVFLFRWKWPLLVMGILAAGVSSVVSLMIEEKFQSSVIFFPAKATSVSKSVMTEDVTGKASIMAFGEEEEAEQMLQILNSDQIRSYITYKYNLFDHYEIDQDGPHPGADLVEEYKSHISFKRTEFESVRIDVLDKDPQLAADMANDIAAQLDSTKNRMQRDRAAEALKVIEREHKELAEYLGSLEDSLSVLAALGVHDHEKQIEMISTEYYRAIAGGNSSAVAKLEEQLAVLAKYGATQMALAERLEIEQDRLGLLRSKLEETREDSEQSIPHKFIVDNAYPADKKAYPVRWLIVVVSTLSTVLFTLLLIIGVENFQRLKAQGKL